MKQIIHGPKLYVQTLAVLICLLVSMPSAYSGMITQIVPTLTISEDYSDNYLQTETDKQKEYITSVGLGFSLGYLTKTRKIYLAFDPTYTKYKNLEDRDRLEPRASFDGEFNPSKHTNINAHLSYDGQKDTNQGDTWENIASIDGNRQLTKNTDFNFSQEYSNKFDENIRTGKDKEHDVNTTFAGISNQFGKNDTMGLDFEYAFDHYKNSDLDTYTKYRPSGFITYWMTPLNGLDSEVSYEKREYDTSISDYENYTGHIRYLRKFSRHFDGYLKYRHFYSDEYAGKHIIFHPSVGFDWDVTKDSGISLGLGVLFHDREDNDFNSEDLFFDIDVYKTFRFSQTRSLSITAASGYEDSSEEDIVTRGFRTYYQGGFDYSHQLQKRLSSSLYGSAKLDQYDESSGLDSDEDTITYLTGIQLNYQLMEHLFLNLDGSYEQVEYKRIIDNRTDETIVLGCGLSWNPLRWLQFNLDYQYRDFQTDTDAIIRGNYTENTAFFSVKFSPTKPVRFDKYDSSPTRQDLENKVFSYGKGAL